MRISQHLTLQNHHNWGFFSFWLIFLVGLVSNISWVVYQNSTADIIAVALLSAALSAIASIPAWILSKLNNRNVTASLIYILLVIGVLSILLLCDWFCLQTFHKVVNQDVVDIIAQTNGKESVEFFSTYLSPLKLVLYISVLVVMIGCLWIAARRISSHKFLNILGGTMALAGLYIWGDCAYNFIKYRNGKSIPQFTTPTRILYSLYILDKEITEIENLATKNLEFINSQKTSLQMRT